jgi:hypothetical protein
MARSLHPQNLEKVVNYLEVTIALAYRFNDDEKEFYDIGPCSKAPRCLIWDRRWLKKEHISFTSASESSNLCPDLPEI